MAIYDRDADPTTAVTAWLSQFKAAATGAITFVAGTDTFHVYWIHRSLQKIVYDLAVSGDDELNLSYPDPSTSAAVGKIITLKDHTTDYSINYLVNDNVMTYHFGGSVSQNNGDDIYYGLKIPGEVGTPMPIKVIQNHVVLTSHWGNGKNQTDSKTLARIMVKGRSGGVDIDNLIVNARLDTWGHTFAVWETKLELGEAQAPVSSQADPQNTTALVTVQAYTIAKSEGYKSLNLDGNGLKPYLGEWSYSPEGSKKALYEFVKSLLADTTAETLYGVAGSLWTGRIYDVAISSGAGTWVQNEAVSWTGGTGNLVGVDTLAGASTARLFFHLNTGVAPSDTDVITGAGAATGVTSGSPTTLGTHVNHLGQFTGAWIGALGIGFKATEVTSADSFKDLDGNIINPPNNVPISGTVECVNLADVPHVMLAKKHAALNSPEYDTYSCTGNISGAGVIDVDAIASDVAQTGYVGVLRTGTTSREYYEYTSWSGTTFTLAGTLAGAITALDAAHAAIFYEPALGAGTTKTVSSSLIYNANISVVGWVRQGDETAPDVWQPISGTIGAAGFSFSVDLSREV